MFDFAETACEDDRGKGRNDSKREKKMEKEERVDAFKSSLLSPSWRNYTRTQDNNTGTGKAITQQSIFSSP